MMSVSPSLTLYDHVGSPCKLHLGCDTAHSFLFVSYGMSRWTYQNLGEPFPIHQTPLLTLGQCILAILCIFVCPFDFLLPTADDGRV
jgi:hypothetical protein